MLYTEPEFVTDGVPVFRDHADPDLFWYLPAQVAIARRNGGKGDPIFSYIKYRDPNGNGGGFLSIQVDLTLPQSTRNKLENQIGDLGLSKNPRLVQVPFVDGAVQCVTLDSGAPADGNAGSGGPTSPGNTATNQPGNTPTNADNPFGNSGGATQGGGNTTTRTVVAVDTGAQKLVNQVLGATKPALQGNNNAIFTLALSQDGAEVVMAALKGGQALLGVIYQLNYVAMQPPLNVKITAEMSQVYKFLGASVSAQYKFTRADLSAAIERLKADKVIKIVRTDTQGTDESGKELDAATKMFTDMIAKDFFTPMLVPGNPRTQMIPNMPYNPNMPYSPTGTFPPTNPLNPFGMANNTGSNGYGIGLDPFGGASGLNSNPFATTGPGSNPFAPTNPTTPGGNPFAAPVGGTGTGTGTGTGNPFATTGSGTGTGSGNPFA
jgi:hypothetical protein